MNYTFNFSLTANDVAVLIAGAEKTVLYSVISMIIGLAIGVACAVGINSKVRWLRMLCIIYVEFVRNTPLLVQIFIIFFGLPTLGIRLDANTAAILAMIFNFGAYASEIVRSGIEAVPHGQIEAAESLGFTSFEKFRHVIILPALEKVYPALVSQFTLLMLGSAVVTAIGAHELTSSANAIASRTFRSFEIYLITTAAYLGLTLAFRGCFAAIAWVIFPRRRALGSRAVGAHS